MNNLVSVIIPSFNCSRYILESIQSVIHQSYQDIEIIIVDDGSTDNTIDIIESIEKAIYIIKQENKGACAARNRGFQESKGDYIQFLDADDILSRSKIEEQINVLIRNTKSITNGRWGRFFTGDPLKEEIKWGPHFSLQKNLGPIEWLCQNHMSQTACWLTPRNLIEKAGPWNESLTQNQDGEFFTRVIAEADKVLYTPEAKVYYRSSIKNSVSQNSMQLEKIESRYRSCESFEKSLLILENSRRTREAIANKYQHFIFGAYPFGKEFARKAQQKIKYLGGSNWRPSNASKILTFIVGLIGLKRALGLRYFVNILKSNIN